MPDRGPNLIRSYIIKRTDGLYWSGGAFTSAREKATRFENIERAYVRLSSNERWEPYQELENKLE